FPQIDVVQLISIIDLNAGSSDQILKCQIAAPPKLGAKRAGPFLKQRQESIGRLEMVHDQDSRKRLGDALRLFDQPIWIAYDADDMADEDVIDRAVGKRICQRVDLENGGVC